MAHLLCTFPWSKCTGMGELVREVTRRSEIHFCFHPNHRCIKSELSHLGPHIHRCFLGEKKEINLGYTLEFQSHDLFHPHKMNSCPAKDQRKSGYKHCRCMNMTGRRDAFTPKSCLACQGHLQKDLQHNYTIIDPFIYLLFIQ